MNVYYIIGFALYSHYVIGAMFADISGLTLLPIFALIGAAVYGAGGMTIHRVSLAYAAAILLVYTAYFIFFDWTEYALFKYGMFLLKALPLLLMGSLIIQHQGSYFRGISLALLVFLGICFLYLALADLTAGVNHRLEIGVFNPIWISRGLFELVLILAIVLQPARRYTLAVFVASVGVAYYAGSKGPILAFLVTYFLWLRSGGMMGGSKVKKLLLYASLFATPVIIYFAVDPTSYVFQRFFLPVPDGTSAELVEASRTTVWPATVSLFFGQDLMPLLFGNGVGSFPQFYFGNGADFRYYPHNLLLELLVEHGALLTLAGCVFLTRKIRNSQSKFKYLLIYFLINSLFSGDLVLNEYIFFYLGLVIADGVQRKQADRLFNPEMLKV